MKTTNINLVIEDFNALLLPEKEYTLEIIRKITIEQKREALAKRIKQAELNYKKGKVKKASLKDLYADLAN